MAGRAFFIGPTKRSARGPWIQLPEPGVSPRAARSRWFVCSSLACQSASAHSHGTKRPPSILCPLAFNLAAQDTFQPPLYSPADSERLAEPLADSEFGRP